MEYSAEMNCFHINKTAVCFNILIRFTGHIQFFSMCKRIKDVTMNQLQFLFKIFLSLCLVICYLFMSLYHFSPFEVCSIQVKLGQ